MKFALDIIFTYMAAIFYNVAHAQYRQCPGTIPLNRTANLIVMLMKSLK